METTAIATQKYTEEELAILSNAPEIFSPEGVKEIFNPLAKVYARNSVSKERCEKAGEALLEKVEKVGMNDELDQEISSYIDKSRATLKKTNEARKPITSAFDSIKSYFTDIEKSVDPTAKGSIPYQLQFFRNEYAAKKRKEAEEQRRQIMEQQQRRADVEIYKQSLSNNCLMYCNGIINSEMNALNTLNSSLNLENREEKETAIKNFSVEISTEALKSRYIPAVQMPLFLSKEEIDKIIEDITAPIFQSSKTAFFNAISDLKTRIVEALPSKIKALEDAKNLDEEQRRKKEEELKRQEEAQAEEARKREEQRQKDQKKNIDVAAKQGEMDSLFASAAVATPTYVPKTSSKKVIKMLSPNGLLDILNMWYIEEGCNLSVDELMKVTVKRMVTLCEKLANDKAEPRLIESEHIVYEEEIKAR